MNEKRLQRISYIRNSQRNTNNIQGQISGGTRKKDINPNGMQRDTPKALISSPITIKNQELHK